MRILTVLAVLVCLPVFALAPTQDEGLRPRVCLNGEWQFQPADNDLTFPPSDKWDAVPIRIPSPWNVNSFSRGDGGDFECFPSYPKSWEGLEAAWHQRTVNVPESMRGKAVFLRFEAVHYWADVYVNGKKAGSHEGGFTPFELDVTDLVRAGEVNEILVGVKAHQLFNVKGRATYGWGSFWGGHIHGIWQDVFLIARPRLHVSDVFVTTDVAERQITIQCTVTNLTKEPAKARINNHIFNADEPAPGSTPAKGFRRAHIELGPGETKTVTLSEPWANPELWWPKDPHLYTLVTRLYPDDTDDTPLDMRRTRFGFRDFKIGRDGKKFELNGVPFSGHGDAWHFMGVPQLSPAYAKAWYEMARSCNINIIRLHAQVYPEYYLDVADEMGMLIVDETALWGSAINFWYDDDFLRRGRQQCRELVLRDRNHPSVALWSVANEIYARQADDNAPSLDWIFARYAEFADEMKALDPSREVSSDGDNDLNGRLNIYSLHYPGPGDPKKGKITTIGEAGSMYYSTPAEVAHAVGDRAYLTSNDRMDAVAIETADLIEGYRKWAAYSTPFNIAWYGLEPLPMDVEFEYDDLETPGVKPERLGPYCTMLNAGRDPKLPEFIPTPLYEAVKDAFEPIRFFVKERSPSVWGNRTVTRNLTVHNDVLEPSELELVWQLEIPDRDPQSGTIELSMQPGEMQELAISFSTELGEEEQSAEVPAELVVILRKGKDICYQQTLALYVVSPELPAKLASEAGPLALYDPDGKTAEVMDWLGFAVTRVETVDELLAQEGIWIIGADSGLSPEEAERVLNAPGGRSVVFENNPGFYGPHGYCSRHSAGFARVFSAGDPDPGQGWAPDGVMARGAFGGEWHGNMVPLVAAGVSDLVVFAGMDWERENTCLFSELAAVEKARDEPEAAGMLAGLAQFMATTVGPPPDVRAGKVVAARGSRFDAATQLLGLADVGPAPSALICDGSQPPQNPALIRRAFAGTDRRLPEDSTPLILIVGLTPEALPAWNALLPVELSLEASDAAQLICDEILYMEPTEDTTLPGMLGMTPNDDRFWIEKENTRKIMDFAVSCDSEGAVPLLVTNHTDWRRWCWRGENTKTAAIIRSEREPFERQTGLLQVRCGKAQLAVSQVRLDPMNPKSMRFYNQLLTSYAVPLRRGEPAGVDLTPFNVDPDGFITTWLLCGPFDSETPHSVDAIGGEATVRPEAGTISGNRVWGQFRSRGPILDLAAKDMFGERQNSAVYAGTWIKAKRETTGNLWLGSDDQVKVWLNGALIHDNPVVRPVTPDNDKVPGIVLNEGWNFLMFKVSQGWGKWGICARLVDDEGGPLKGLLIDPAGMQVEREPLSRDRWKASAMPVGEGPGRAIDDDAGTRWSSGAPMGPGMWFALDLGEAQEVSQIVLDSGNSPGDYPRGLKLEVSDDGGTWRTLADCADAASAQSAGVTSIIIPPTVTRHLRVTQTGPEGCAGGLYWSIHDLRLLR